MKILNKFILEELNRAQSHSHKGQNGRILIIAGSNKYHGALLLAVKTASRIVDMVYVHSVKKNLKLIKKLRRETATFIAVDEKELFQTAELVDVILMGPGLPEDSDTIKLVHDILHRFEHKKTVIDATALWHVKPDCLHKNCILTPHSREFSNVFQCAATKENVLAMAKKYHCTIILTGEKDYISDGKELWENKTGNVGMTKGGTGDVLAGIVGSFACANDCLSSALAGAYLNGMLGDRLKEKVGTFYNAEDLITELGKVWKEFF